MNSLEKINQALDNIERVAEDPNADLTTMAAASMLVMGRSYIDKMLPDSIEELDALLEQGAQWLLSLKSDPPGELTPAADQLIREELEQPQQVS